MGGYRTMDATCRRIQKVKLFDCRKCCRRLLTTLQSATCLDGVSWCGSVLLKEVLWSRSSESDAVAVSRSHR